MALALASSRTVWIRLVSALSDTGKRLAASHSHHLCSIPHQNLATQTNTDSGISGASEPSWSLWCFPGKAESMCPRSSLFLTLCVWIKSLLSSHTFSFVCTAKSSPWAGSATSRNGLSSEVPSNWEKHSTCKVLYLMVVEIFPLFL